MLTKVLTKAKTDLKQTNKQTKIKQQQQPPKRHNINTNLDSLILNP